MTFYQELQLSSTGSKQLIRNTTDPKEKRRHILIYNFKVYLVMAFCVAVVSMYSKLTGSSNSVVGVTVLLAVLVLRQADFGIRTTHGLLSIAGIFGILMAGPRLANMVPPLAAFAFTKFAIILLLLAVNINCLFILGEASNRGFPQLSYLPFPMAKILRFFEIKRYFFRKKLANVPANVPNFCKRFKYFQAITGNHFPGDYRKPRSLIILP